MAAPCQAAPSKPTQGKSDQKYHRKEKGMRRKTKPQKSPKITKNLLSPHLPSSFPGLGWMVLGADLFSLRSGAILPWWGRAGSIPAAQKQPHGLGWAEPWAGTNNPGQGSRCSGQNRARAGCRGQANADTGAFDCV